MDAFLQLSLDRRRDASAEAAPSRKKRSQTLDALRAACQTYIRDSLAPALGARIAEKLDPDDCELVNKFNIYMLIMALGAAIVSVCMPVLESPSSVAQVQFNQTHEAG